MKSIIIRNVPQSLSEAIENRARLANQSINLTVIDILKEGLGLRDGKRKARDLTGLAGAWGKAEAEEFEKATAVFETDEEWPQR